MASSADTDLSLRQRETKTINVRDPGSTGGPDYNLVVDTDVHGLYREMKRDAQGRLDRTELTNGEFLALLLDVYHLHLQDDLER